MSDADETARAAAPEPALSRFGPAQGELGRRAPTVATVDRELLRRGRWRVIDLHGAAGLRNVAGPIDGFDGQRVASVADAVVGRHGQGRAAPVRARQGVGIATAVIGGLLLAVEVGTDGLDAGVVAGVEAHRRLAADPAVAPQRPAGVDDRGRAVVRQREGQVAQRDVRVGAAGARAAGVHALHDEADLVDAAVEVPPEVQPRAEAGAADLGGAADPPVVVLVHDPGRPPGALSVLVVPVPLAAERDDRGVGRRRQADLAPHTARRGRAGALHVQAGDLRGRRPRTSGAGEHRREVVADPHGAAVAVSATLSDRVGARAGGRAEHQCHE